MIFFNRLKELKQRLQQYTTSNHIAVFLLNLTSSMDALGQGAGCVALVPRRNSKLLLLWESTDAS